MSAPRVFPAGDRGLLVELDDNHAVHSLAGAARETWGDALEEVVPGHSTLLLVWRARTPEDAAERAISLSYLTLDSSVRLGPELTIPTRYDGPDLGDVARSAGLGVDQVIELHTATTYTAAFVGFAPGFAYLIGGDDRLALPRRDRPRVRVDAGSVAVAAGYCAIYPSAGPGGWHILGHTDLPLFDPGRDPAALVEPGATIRFEAVA